MLIPIAIFSIAFFQIAFRNSERFVQLVDTGTPFITDSATMELPTGTSDSDEAPASTETFAPALVETETKPPAITASINATYTPSETMPPPTPLPNLDGEYVSNEILVKLRTSTSIEDIKNCFELSDYSVISNIQELNYYVLKVPQERMWEIFNSLKSCAGIKKVEPNYIAEMADIIPNDPGLVNQYGLIAIRAPKGWELSTGSTAVTVAIVDTGIQLLHPDLAGKVTSGYDFVNSDTSPDDDNGHGTHVAGIAAAMTNDGTGIAGVSWGARLMPVKVLDTFGNGTYANVAQGIVWAVDHGSQIINLSLGGNSPSQVLQDAVDYAYAKGVLVVAAAGNSGDGIVLYPARYPHVLAITATDSSNNRAGFSNYGPEVDLSAPGVGIYSTWLGGTYQNDSGTSMSAPFVSGLAAVLWGLPGNGSPDIVAAEMENSALDLGIPGRDNFFGYGLIQMDRAIKLALPGSTSTLTPFQHFPAQGNQFLLTQTPTFAPTWTATTTLTPLPTSYILLPSVTSTITAFSTVTQTPVSVSRSTSWIQRLNAFLSPLFCCGVSLILLGLILFWLSRGKQRRKSKMKL